MTVKSKSGYEGNGAAGFMKKLFIVLLCIAVMLMLLCGRLRYVTRYRITDIDAIISLDGRYEVIFQTVGEPDWPFGASHARIVLKEGNHTLTKYQFDVANDGGTLSPENWSVTWQDSCVQAVISGEEQRDTLYTFYFDGTVDSEVLDGQEPGLHGET